MKNEIKDLKLRIEQLRRKVEKYRKNATINYSFWKTVGVDFEVKVKKKRKYYKRSLPLTSIDCMSQKLLLHNFGSYANKN